METKAIFLDVDGTLVSFDTHRVPQSAIEALQQVHESDIKIIIATGRAFTDLHELEEIPYDAVIALNGADCVLRDGTPISRKQIPEKDFQRVLVLAQHYGFALAIETNKGIFVNELNPTVIELARLVNHPTPPVAFLAKYPKYEIILNMYSRANDCPATWENLSKVRLQTFVDYMEERLAPNSVRQYAAKLKAVLNLYNEEVELPKDYNKILSVKNVRSTNVWLTDEELERIITYAPKNTNEQLVRTQFLIGAFTGCRHSDYTRLNNRNIVGGMISYVSLKTKTHATVPLKPIVKELLTNLPKEEVSDPTFNNNIRNICRKAGITEAVKVFKAGKEVEGEKWEFVSSHTARRSFATNLYLRGADLYSISQMMGHASVEMTQNYLCCGLREQSAQVMEYFK